MSRQMHDSTPKVFSAVHNNLYEFSINFYFKIQQYVCHLVTNHAYIQFYVNMHSKLLRLFSLENVKLVSSVGSPSKNVKLSPF